MLNCSVRSSKHLPLNNGWAGSRTQFAIEYDSEGFGKWSKESLLTKTLEDESLEGFLFYALQFCRVIWGSGWHALIFDVYFCFWVDSVLTYQYCSFKIWILLLGHCVVVAHRSLKPLVLVRFQLPLPYKNTLNWTQDPRRLKVGWSL